MDLSLNEAINYGVKYHQAGDLNGAEGIYNDILRHFPNHIDILHLKGVISNQRGEYKNAILLINQAISHIPSENANNPAFSSFYQNLANAYFQDGDMTKAKEAYAHAIRLQPANVDARFNLSKLLKDEKLFCEALSELDTVLSLVPTYANALSEKAKIYFELGNYGDAEAFFERRLAVDSFDYEANIGLAKCHFESGSFEKAQECFEKCTKLGSSLHEPHFWLGLLYSKKGDEEAGVKAYEKCLEINPNFVPALINLANAYKNNNQIRQAMSALEHANEVEPDNYEVNFCLGATCVDANLLEDAVKYLTKANEIKPTVACSLALAKTLERSGQKTQAKDIFEKIYHDDAQHLEALSHLVALKMDIFEHEGLADLKNELVALAEECGGAGLNPFDICTKFQFIPPIKRKEYLQNYCKNAFGDIQKRYARRYDFTKRAKNERLKVGFLSSDYKDQATMHLACGMFEYFDKDEFEVYALALGFDENSYHYKRVHDHVDRFVDLGGKSYLEVADEIFALGIDILIDLNSHSNGAMMEALALKPAPTQITYLYHPSTSGAKFMDYCLVDEIVASMQDMELFSEKLVYLPDCYQVNDGKQPISDKAYSKTELGFGEEDFIFCCFNAPWKIEADIFEIWMRILDKTPNAKLWLLRFNDTACENIKKAAASASIDSARIIFADNMPKDKHLARLKIADLLLDTRPYNAHTTASDALFVGVPVLTVRGDSFASRVAESLLVNAGLGKELVSKDLCEYEQMALALTSSNDEIAKYKSFLDAHIKTCALFDTKRFVRGLETVLKKL